MACHCTTALYSNEFGAHLHANPRRARTSICKRAAFAIKPCIGGTSGNGVKRF